MFNHTQQPDTQIALFKYKIVTTTKEHMAEKQQTANSERSNW